MKTVVPLKVRIYFSFFVAGLLLLLLPRLSFAQTETEPNNDFATANVMSFATTMSGTTCAPDIYDHFRCVLPQGGKSIRLITNASMVNVGQTGGIYVYLFNKYQQQLTNQYIALTSVNKIDTLNFSCFEGDTFYVRVYNYSNQAGCKQYTVRYDYTTDFTLQNDKEVNDDFSTALHLPFGQDTTGHLGSQRYIGNGAVNDVEDFYRIVMPAGGKSLRLITSTRAVQPGASGTGVYYYFYNKFQQQLTNKYVGFTNTFKADTMDYSCFEGDTFYVRVYNYNNQAACKEYKLRVEYTNDFTLANDKEVNDDFSTALHLPFGKDTTGHLGSQRYVNNAASNDIYDYYRLVMPPGAKSLRLISSTRAVQAGASGTGVYYYFYNKFQQQLTNRYVPITNTFKADTMDYTCFEGDTFYVRVYNYNNQAACKEYKFRVETTGLFTMSNDKELNDDFPTAVDLPFDKDTSGHLGSQRYIGNSAVNDVYDYYRFISPPGVKAIRLVTATRMVEPGETGGMYYYIFNKARQQVDNKYVSLTNTLKADTMQLDCFASDTFYVRVYNYSNQAGCKEYRLNMSYEDLQPKAKITAARTGDEFGFVAETKNADWIEWDFDNGVKSNFRYPTQTFEAGGYNIKLRGRNTNCNVTAVDSLFVEVKGVESFKPAKAGVGGDLLMSIYGGGLDSTTNVKLVKGSMVLQPFAKQSNSKRNMLTANFDFHFAEAGMYDVVIEIPGEAPYVFPQAFEMEPFHYPFAKAEIIGPSRWRINRETNFELKVSNSGNVNGSGVVIGFVYPKSVEVKFVPKQTKLDRSATTTIEVDGEIFSLSNAETAEYADSASQPTPIDFLNGEPYDGYMIYLTLPKLPYNGSVTMPFKAKTTSSGSPMFYTFTHHPNIFGSCETPHWSNTTNMMMAEGIDALDIAVDNSKAPGIFKAFTKALKIGQKHIAHAGSSAGAHFDAWYNDYEVTGEMYGVLNAELDEANAFALKTATEELGTAAFKNGMGKMAGNNKLKNEWWNKQMANNQHLSPESFDKFLDKINALDKSSKRLDKLGKMLIDVKDLNTLNDKIAALQKLAEDCPELQPQIEDLLEMFEEELDHKDPNEKPTQSVQSMDPNAIYGPEGILTDRYRKDLERMHYLVTCENMDTATAPAQVVRIVDTLDPALFDFSTFEFGNVYIGKKAARLLSGRDEFFGTVSLYPEIPLVAQIVAKLDKTTGVITWDMIGIDTNTHELPVDPDLGLLPPNTTSPIGEAGVSYSVKLKAGLPSGTQIQNRALIYFDENEPIFTNTWSNKLDIIAPKSNVMTPTLIHDTIIRLQFSGSDAESGIAKYRLHVKSDTGSWQPLGIVNADTVWVAGNRGRTYDFYVSALDYVGNVETKIPGSEANITVPLKEIPDPDGSEVFNVYPNPTSGQLFIQSESEVTGATLIISDVTGRTMRTATLDLKARVAQSIDLSGFANGVYLMAITGPGMQEETFKILLAKPGE